MNLNGFLVGAFFLTSLNVIAAEKLTGNFNISTGEIVPYTISHKAGTFEIEGFAGEIVTAALKKAGLDKQFAIKWAPWKRAQDDAQATPNTIIFPLTRTAAREPLYKWVNLLVTVNCHAFALDPKAKIDSLADIKGQRIAALAGSPPEIEVKKLLGDEGSKGMDPAADEDTNYKKLVAGRVAIWATQDVVAPFIAKKNGASDKLRKGYKFFDQPLWIAAHKDTKDSDIAAITKAMEEFRKDPKYNEILKKYGVL